MSHTPGRPWMSLVMAVFVAPAVASAQEPSLADFVGSWRLESWTLADGRPRCSEAEGAVSGQIVYTSDGYMSAQLGCAQIDLSDISDLSPQEVRRRISRRHLSYYGTYTLDAPAQAVIHHVQGSYSPNMVGSAQVREFVFEGNNRLTLSPQGSGQRLLWLRNPEANEGSPALSALDELVSRVGTWTGTNRLRDPSMNVSDDSPSTAALSPLVGGKFVRMDYTWSYQGAPQEGSLLIGYESGPAVVTAHWVDTWHMGEGVMALRGTSDTDGSITVHGTYAAPPGPDWGWRIDLLPGDDSALRLVMYNITPDGQEELAVEADYARTGGNSDR